MIGDRQYDDTTDEPPEATVTFALEAPDHTDPTKQVMNGKTTPEHHQYWRPQQISVERHLTPNEQQNMYLKQLRDPMNSDSVV